MRIIIDFDGTICKTRKFPEFGSPTPGCREAIKALMDAGHRIYIHSCRWSRDLCDVTMIERRMSQVRSYLSRHNIPYTDLVVYSKPTGDVYIDDRGMRYDGDWDEILLVLGLAALGEDDV